MSQKYSLRKVGRPNTLQYRIFIEENGVPVSPFHDIPLYANAQGTVLNMVVEIPRWTNSKFEISRDELLNPIMQDVKDGKLRHVKNSYPFHGYIWNYGALPQTWEDPSFINPDTKAKGDNDPIDACEIGQRVGYTGEIKQVKVLGIMALLDNHETDWKVIVIDINDPLAPSLNDIGDIEMYFPGLIDGTRRWFKTYKVPDGKPENDFAFSGECRNKEHVHPGFDITFGHELIKEPDSYAMDIIRDAAKAWKRLINGDTDPGSISLANASVKDSPNYVSSKDLHSIPAAEDLEQAPFDPIINRWFFNSKHAQHKI